MKDYISITKETADKMMYLSLIETYIFTALAMKADESGKVDIEYATKGLPISKKSKWKAISLIENAGLIIQTGTTAQIQNWGDFQL